LCDPEVSRAYSGFIAAGNQVAMDLPRTPLSNFSRLSRLFVLKRT
jgi:hypothetical protein